MDKKEARRYVLDNIDNAINKGYIKLYYQPILRSMTGEICAMEGLARWIDPKLGMISPGDFVPVLEEERLIYKLDTFLIEQMCKEYSLAFERGEDMLPVSLNFSRHDFEDVDINKVLNTNLKKYNVPREMLNIEITESAVGKNKEFMKEEFKKLHEEGYEVWMDDFGSEYSTLNMLKDFDFDVVKLDMKFVETCSVKSKQIVKFMIDMLKTIGIKTLAEGVETKEQLEFLTNLGCDKIQGYYIAKPMPGRDVKEYLKSRGYKIEKNIDMRYNDEIAKINILSSKPVTEYQDMKNKTIDVMGYIDAVSLIEVENETLRFKYYNEIFLKEISSLGIESIEEMREKLLDREHEFHKKLKYMIYTVDETGKESKADGIVNGCFYLVRLFKIAEEGRRRTYAYRIENVSNNTDFLRQYNRFKERDILYSLFDIVDIIDLKNYTIESIFKKSLVNREANNLDAQSHIEEFCNRNVYPIDKETVRNFYDMSTVEERLKESKKNILVEYFRAKKIGKGYNWHIGFLVKDEGEEKDKLLSCIVELEDEIVRRMPLERMLSGIKEDDVAFSDASLWKNFTTNTDIGIFWKDKNRRFVGVNRAFLDYYNIKSVDNIIGKNDEDMGWHVDPEKFKDDEEDILKMGIQTHGVHGTCINDGSIKNIRASKMPYYRNGKIEGIIGYFVEETDNNMLGKVDSYMDEVTGALNMKGLLDTVQNYIDSYIMHRRDFDIYYIDIVNFRHFVDSNGVRLSTRVLQEVVNKIKEVVGVTGTVARIGGDHFVVLKSVTTDEEDMQLQEEIKEEVYNIRRIDHVPCTIYLTIESEKFSEVENMEKIIEHLIREVIRADVHK